LGTDFGGAGARVDLPPRGTQWGDVGEIALSSDTVQSGHGIKIKFAEQDGQSASRVAFFLDTDKNPYDGNNARTLASETFSQADKITGEELKGGTAGVQPGKYFVYARITASDGLMRYAYASQELTIT
jgi:hypothetical protein